MTITWQQFTWIAGILLAWNGFLVSMIWFLFKSQIKQFKLSLVQEFGGLKTDIDEVRRQAKADVDEVKRQAESDRQDWRRIDTEVKNLLVRLPIDYQRREDSIREYTVINGKLDRLYENSLKKDGKAS